MNRNRNGWGLVETLLTLGTITALSAGIYMVFPPANASAQTRAEQQNIGELSQMVENAFGLTGTFEHVNTQRLISERLIPTGMLAGGRLNSSWGGSVVVEPYAVRFLGDAFAITYTNTSKEVCNRLSAAASGQVHDILVNGTSIFTTSRFSPIAATQECAEGSEVVFVFHPTGINQAYASDPLDLPPPPTSVTPDWNTPITTVVDEAKNVADATGMPLIPPASTGGVTAPSTPLPGAVAPSLPNPAPAPSPSNPSPPITVVSECQNGYEDRNLSCPAGQYGTGIQRQIFGCVLNASDDLVTKKESWIPWQAPNDQRLRLGWNTISGACATCPASSTGAEYQWIETSAACPSGQLGNNTWQKEQVRSRSVAYNCPAGTTVIPAPTYGAWGGWGDTGTTRNSSNTCAPACVLPSPNSQSQTESRTATQTLTCPTGQLGSVLQSRQEMRSQSRSASCPAPTGSYAWGSWSSWSSWTATTTWTTVSDSCVSNKVYAWELMSHTGDQLIPNGPCTTSTIPTVIPVCSSATEGQTYTYKINRGTCAPVYMQGVSIDTYQCVGK